MTLKVLLFAQYREQAGVKALPLELPEGATVRDAAAALEARYPDLKLKGALAAIDEAYAPPDAQLGEGAVLAFFPPVAGGSGQDDPLEGDHFFVTEAPLELAHYVALVSAPAYGAVSTFSGTVRSPNHGQDVRSIDYQGYEPMILSQMKRAALELRERFELGRITFAHRLGLLLPGEASIAIAISSAHRRDSLLATHAAIDRLKELLPVWKLETNTDGSHWVEGSATAAETL
jgi:molybdopterin synthase catalytic subunit/molybdopterin converting factor small subunit